MTRPALSRTAQDIANEGFVREFQEIAVQRGFSLKIDGWAGQQTERVRDALFAALPANTPRPVLMPVPPTKAPKAAAEGIFNATSERLLDGIHPDLVRVMREARQSHVFDIIEGLRTPARQKELFDRGLSKTMASRHLTGHAVDIWPIDPMTQKRATHPDARERDKLLWALLRPIAETAKRVAKDRGILLEWGGDWGWDAPHFQLNRQRYP